MNDALSPRAARWQIKLLAIVLPLAGLVGADLVLRALALRPPDPPLLFHARSTLPAFSPFVETQDGAIAIREDWVNSGRGLRGRRGSRAGREFIHPGFRPTRFPRAKPEATLRIFALGGSTTFGLHLDPEQAFPARMQDGLRDALPARGVDVVNLGCAGWASDRVLNVLDAVFELEPDLLLVYTGHNEMLGGPVGSRLDAPQRLRARLLAASPLYAWIDHVLSRVLRWRESEWIAEEVAAVREGRIPAYEPRSVEPAERVLPSDAFRAASAERYAANVAAIASRARAAGVPVLFVVPVGNLLRPPAIAAHPPGFGDEDAFRSAVDAARLARRAGRADEALAHIESAVALSPGHAMAHYQRAELLRDAGRIDAARAAYQAAVDRDMLTHRITSPLESALLDALRESGSTWLDLRAEFRGDLDRETAGALFLDHLHPTPEGHALIAERALPMALQLLERDAGPSG